MSRTGHGFILTIFFAAALSGLILLAEGAAKCPPGTTAMEDVATGKVICERGDSLDSGSMPRTRVGKPGSPGKPGTPASPASPGAPEEVSPGKPENCGLARWGCEQVCEKIYLTSATGAAANAAQRAKVAYGACLRVCGEKFECKAKAPSLKPEKASK